MGQEINGKYRVLSLLGEGGFGVVYRVEHLLFDSANIFALKLLHPSLSEDKQFRLRFLREAGLAMSLVHENTIQIREFGQTEDGHLFFTMDYCEGEPLKNVIDREGFLPLNRTLEITRQILCVMKQAHFQGIIHRDLKPENIFLERRAGRDFVKVGDFGLAKSLSAGDELSDITRGGILGTPRYMSPEQAKGWDDLDGRSDLYSVGVMLHEMLYGDVPASKRLEDATEEEYKLDCPPETGHAVPSEVWKVVRTSLQERRESRHQTADDFVVALDSLPSYTPTYIQPLETKKRAHGLLRSASVLLVLAGLGAVGLDAFRNYGDSILEWVGERTPVATGSMSATQAPIATPGGSTSTVAAEAVATPQLFSQESIEDFLKFAPGDKLDYQVVRDGVSTTTVSYLVVAKESDSTYRVRADPSNRLLRWIVSPEDNAFSWRWHALDPERGEENLPRETLWLQLPIRFRQDVYPFGRKRRVFRQAVDLVRETPVKITFRSCLLVEFNEESYRVHRHYYGLDQGLVAMEVLEKRAGVPDEVVFGRYLVGRRKEEIITPASGGIGTAPVSSSPKASVDGDP